MPLTILSGSDVHDLLHALTQTEIQKLLDGLADALREYSTGDTNSSCSSTHQPLRTVIKREGTTALFMPSSTSTNLGLKMVALEDPATTNSASTSDGSSLATSLSQTSVSSLSLSQTSTGTSSVSGSSFSPPASVASVSSTNPRGTLTILDRSGVPVGFMDAGELTAFRTALAASIIFAKRHAVQTIAVFGAGRQAYWAIRLALMLRGNDIHHVHIINRSSERSIKLVEQFQGAKSQDRAWTSNAKFTTLSPASEEYGRLLKEEVRKADVIFCCTPSTDPLFPPEFLTSHEGRKKGRYVSAIGSHTPQMTEIHPDIFRQAAAPIHHHHHHKHAKTSGAVVVDSLESCLKEAGEIIQAALKPAQLVEIGELMMIKKAAMEEIEHGGSGEQGLRDWLIKGSVVFKSVGLGLMDLRVGLDLVGIARDKGLGTIIHDF